MAHPDRESVAGLHERVMSQCDGKIPAYVHVAIATANLWLAATQQCIVPAGDGIAAVASRDVPPSLECAVAAACDALESYFLERKRASGEEKTSG